MSSSTDEESPGIARAAGLVHQTPELTVGQVRVAVRIRSQQGIRALISTDSCRLGGAQAHASAEGVKN